MSGRLPQLWHLFAGAAFALLATVSPLPASAAPTIVVLETVCANGAAIEKAAAAEARADPHDLQASSDAHVRAADQFKRCADDGPNDFIRSASEMLYLTRMQSSHLTYAQNDLENPGLYDLARHLRMHMAHQKASAYAPYVRALASIMQTLDSDYLTAARKLHGRVPPDLRDRR